MQINLWLGNEKGKIPSSRGDFCFEQVANFDINFAFFAKRLKMIFRFVKIISTDLHRFQQVKYDILLLDCELVPVVKQFTLSVGYDNR